MMIGMVSQLVSNSAAGLGGLARPSPGSGASSRTAGSDFSQVLSQLSSEAVDTIKHGEAMSIEGMEGKASVQQVVEAVISAEQTLQTVVAIRDKVVAAYQQISQMAI